MKVFKFGGASVNNIERIHMVGKILKQLNDEKLLIVISAMGKTTNALEKVVEAFYGGKKEESLQLFQLVKNQHLVTAKQLLVTHYLACEEQLKNFFTEAEWLLHDDPQKPFDYYYDQVVCIGELLSTTIVSFYLNEIGIKNKEHNNSYDERINDAKHQISKLLEDIEIGIQRKNLKVMESNDQHRYARKVSYF